MTRLVGAGQAFCCWTISPPWSSWLLPHSQKSPRLYKFCRRATCDILKQVHLYTHHQLDLVTNMATFWKSCEWMCANGSYLDAIPMCSSWLWKLSNSASMPSACCGERTQVSYLCFYKLFLQWASVHPRAPSYFSDIMHEVHAGLVGLGVCQIEQRGHPEANGIGTVTTLQRNLF